MELTRLYATEGGRGKESLLAVDWSYGNRLSPDLEEVAKELNGQVVATGRQVSGFSELKDDGSTRCGNWIYSGSYTEAGNMMARKGQEDPTGLGLFPNYSWSWPSNRRILYNRASADAEGKPWDETRAPLRFENGRYVGDVADFKADASPEDLGAFIMLPEGVAKLFTPDFAEGPFPEHYEPVESPVANALHPEVGSNPMATIFRGELDALGKVEQYPYVALTYRLTEHFHYWTKHVETNSLLQSDFFVEVPEALAREKGIRSGDRVRVTSARGAVEGAAMVTKRVRPLERGRQDDLPGRPSHSLGFSRTGEGAAHQ